MFDALHKTKQNKRYLLWRKEIIKKSKRKKFIEKENRKKNPCPV